MGTTTKKPDKRKTPPPGYKGTRAPQGSKTAAFKGKLSDAIKDSQQLTTMIDFLETESRLFNEELTSDEKLMREAIRQSHVLAKGNFYTWLSNRYGKKYLQHRKGCNNAWYFHNSAELVRRTAKQLKTISDLTNICQKWNWSERKLRKIQLEAHEILGKWYSKQHIKNICRSRTYPSYPAEQAYVLDYGTQSKHTITVIEHNVETGRFAFDLSVSSPEEKNCMVRFEYTVPERILAHETRLVSIRKPVLYKDVNGIWCFSIPYWFTPCENSSSKHGHLGSDAGFVRVFRGGVVYPDGSYIENLDPSEETEKTHNHAEVLHDLKSRLYDKAWHKRNLASHCKDASTKSRLEAESNRLFVEYDRVRSNYAAEREHVSCLVARDLVAFAREFSCDQIHVEDLRWVGGSGQSWNYAATIEDIENVAARYNIKVVKVNPFMSSRTDPLTGLLFDEDASPGLADERFEIWCDDSVHDRDGGSGLELACRPRRGVKDDTQHERNLVCEIVPRKRCRSYGKGKRSAWMGKHWCKRHVTEGYRPSEDFLVSVREAREAWREAKKAEDNRVGCSRSVSMPGEPRSVEAGVSQSINGVPARNACVLSTQNQTVISGEQYAFKQRKKRIITTNV